MREKGVLGVAARLVKYPARYEKLVNTLLGRTIVVQDTSGAGRLRKRGLGTLVTVDGIVFHPSGAITGGQPQASRPLVLGYERDLESIPKEIDRIQRSLAITEREADSVRDQLRQAEAALGSLGREAEETLDRRTGLQDSLSQRQQRLAQLRGELRGLVASQAGLREQQRTSLLEAERLGQERERMLAEAKECQETAKYLERGNSLLNERRQALQRAVNEAAGALARVDGEYRSLAVQREAGQAALARPGGLAPAQTPPV